jgi:hypothetical protein
METLLIISFLLNVAAAYIIWVLWRNNRILKANIECLRAQINYSPTLFDKVSRMSPLILGGLLVFTLMRKIKADEKVDAAYIASLKGKAP